MLVRDAGDAWQLVLQPHHADLCGQFARAWGGPGFAPPQPLDAVALAATRHDDGWATWERQPRLDPAHGRPQSFFEVPVPVHLAFYRAGVEVVRDEDPYAGLLVSMHLSGLYRGRYGVTSTPPRQLSDELRGQVDAFVAEEEARQATLARRLGVAERERWTNYALLQAFDVLSLHCGLADLEGGTASATIEGVPTADGTPAQLALDALGPWRARLAPYPFLASPARFTLVRRLLPKREWSGDADFREDLHAVPFETVELAFER